MLFAFAQWATGQITVTKSTFPAVGDTLFTSFRSNPDDTLLMGNVGGPQVWDFSTLAGGEKQRQIFVNPSAGKDAAQFPESNLLLLSGNQEQYLKSTDTKIEGLGLGGENPFFQGPFVIKYSKRPVFRRAPLAFIQTTSSDSKFNLDISTSIIPDSILASLPVKPDSIRIEFNSTDRGLMDAYGTLKLGGKEFAVLREKVESITETKLLVKVLGLWIDPSVFLGGEIPGGFGAFLGKDTSYVFNFYTNTRKEVIVSANYSVKNEFQGVEFVDLNPYASATENTAWPSVRLYPNPVTDRLTVAAGDILNGSYMTTVSDARGQIVMFDASAWASGDKKEFNTSGLSSGVYILQVRDKNNRPAFTARFIK